MSAHITSEEIKKTLASEPFQGKHLLEPLKSRALAEKIPLNILEDKEVINEAEVHRHEGDLWQCLEGEVEFTVGGELIEPWPKKNKDGSIDEREWKAKEIKNGTKVILKVGDWLWIPAGEPHQHSKPQGHARLYIIKIPLT